VNTEDQSNSGLKKIIFLIDDNEDVLAVIKISLEMLGYDVVEFTQGRGAVKKFLAVQPSLAIVDQGLPDIEGLEVGRQLRELETDSRCALILLTGSDGQLLRDRASDIGFDGFLVKPVSIQTLSECIDQQIKKQP
jgi:DNA-binding response OmpR family regulator